MPLYRGWVRGFTIIPAGAVLSGVITMADFVGGIVYIPDHWTSANVGFAVGYDRKSGPWSPLYDENGNLVQIRVSYTNRAFVFPPEVFTCGYIRFWSQRDASNKPQASKRRLYYELKS